MTRTAVFLLLPLSAILVMCKQPEITGASSLRHYEFGEEFAEVFKLDKELNEISGLAFLPNGALLAHNDETGKIFQLDPESGAILATRTIGKKTLKDDFEDIAAVGDTIYLVNSSGTLFQLIDTNKKYYDYIEMSTELGSRNNVEGLCYDPETYSLLLACKEHPLKNHKGYRAVYAFSLATHRLNPNPRFLMKTSAIARSTKEMAFMPSGIAYHPIHKTFYIIAAQGNTLIEISPDGVILGQITLPHEVHRQPEGIAIATDGTLYIANEANGKHPRLVRYAYMPK